MATITSLGAGSGLDLESLVTKLMAVEQAPLTALQTKETSVNTKISAFGTLKSKLSALQTAAQALKANIGQTALQKFATYSTTVADTSIASATASTGAVAGTYALNVTKLAVSDQFVSSTVTSASDPIGTDGDTLTFNFATPDADGNSRTKTITLDSSNNSLTGLRNSINGANMGVTATIITGSAGAQLVLTGEQGLDNKITLGGNLASQLSQTATADSAAFTVNGIAATSNTNAASKVIDGVTLNLTKTGSTTLTVAAEYSSNLSTALNSFIKAYNDANSTMTTLGAYNATTKVAGTLQGNSLLRDARQETRSLVFGTTVGGTSAYQRLSDIGVSVGTDGSLSLDTTKLNKALASDTVSVATLVDKVGTAFNTSLDKVVGTSGKIKIATDSANSMIKELQKRQDSVQLHLDQIEARYRKRFTALDTLVAKLNSTSTYLTTQLANLTSTSSNQQGAFMFGTRPSPTAAYAQVSLESAVHSADPHRLVLLLFEGAATAMSMAKLHMQNNQIAERGANISKAIDIIANGLRASLNIKEGGELAERLAALYDYIVQRLLWANMKVDVVALDECMGLLGEIHSAWAEISPGKEVAA